MIKRYFFCAICSIGLISCVMAQPQIIPGRIGVGGGGGVSSNNPTFNGITVIGTNLWTNVPGYYILMTTNDPRQTGPRTTLILGATNISGSEITSAGSASSGSANFYNGLNVRAGGAKVGDTNDIQGGTLALRGGLGSGTNDGGAVNIAAGGVVGTGNGANIRLTPGSGGVGKSNGIVVVDGVLNTGGFASTNLIVDQFMPYEQDGFVVNGVLTNTDTFSPLRYEAVSGGLAFGDQQPAGASSIISAFTGSLAFGMLDGSGTNIADGIACIAGGHTDTDIIRASGYGSMAFGEANGSVGGLVADGSGNFALGLAPLWAATGQAQFAFGTGYSNLVTHSFMVGWNFIPTITIIDGAMTNTGSYYGNGGGLTNIPYGDVNKTNDIAFTGSFTGGVTNLSPNPIAVDFNVELVGALTGRGEVQVIYSVNTGSNFRTNKYMCANSVTTNQCMVHLAMRPTAYMFITNTSATGTARILPNSTLWTTNSL